MNHLEKKIFTILLVLVTVQTFGQSSFISGQDSLRNPITVAVPFLNFAPDSRASAMGDVGVATSPDANSIHWNNAKLAFIDTDMGFAFSYSPWLGNIVDDMSLNYLSFYKKIDQNQAFGASFRYFDLGEIALYDEFANPNGVENPSELAFDGTYSRKLSERLSLGVTLRFIWSNLAGNITGAPDAKAGTSVAVDFGVFYTKPFILSGKNSELSLGAHLSNIGQKITYSAESNENFIPANFRLGSAFKTDLDQYNTITLAFDINKLMVPTPPIYQTDGSGNIETDANGNKIIAKGKDPDRSLLSGTFGSFGDAPRGFKEELQELTYSIGAEYWYRDLFAARAGYFSEHKNKGDRKYFTVGAGFRYQIFGFDFSYLIPKGQNHPLADTLRISLLFNLNQGGDQSGE
ncbi:type IX secretion system outer membrane channel protein PorV [Ekhidna sp. To15]|uniref:type IX secretion system outer membrane channel protein PorV n=1 Tax=Ekhidna sp. To15 TaxID=3395267 RepID=UPI003F51F4D5